MKLSKNLHLKKIDLRKIGGEESCDHPDISDKKTYIVKYDGQVLIGQFEKEWYGWNFSWFWMLCCGIQLDALDEVWEIMK